MNELEDLVDSNAKLNSSYKKTLKKFNQLMKNCKALKEKNQQLREENQRLRGENQRLGDEMETLRQEDANQRELPQPQSIVGASVGTLKQRSEPYISHSTINSEPGPSQALCNVRHDISFEQQVQNLGEDDLSEILND